MSWGMIGNQWKSAPYVAISMTRHRIRNADLTQTSKWIECLGGKTKKHSLVSRLDNFIFHSSFFNIHPIFHFFASHVFRGNSISQKWHQETYHRCFHVLSRCPCFHKNPCFATVWCCKAFADRGLSSFKSQEGAVPSKLELPPDLRLVIGPWWSSKWER